MAFLPLYVLAKPLVPSLLEVLIVLGSNGFGGWVWGGGEPGGPPVFLIPCLYPRRAWAGARGPLSPRQRLQRVLQVAAAACASALALIKSAPKSLN